MTHASSDDLSYACTLDMGILSYKILFRQDDNENFFVATKKKIMTMKNLDQNSTKKGHFVFYSSNLKI